MEHASTQATWGSYLEAVRKWAAVRCCSTLPGAAAADLKPMLGIETVSEGAMKLASFVTGKRVQTRAIRES